jgi:EF-P beta-lysylation protein EpmB
MITPMSMPWQSDAWTRELADAVTDVDELLALVGLDRSAVAVDPAPDFPLRVPRAFVARMQYRCPDDPLLRQVLPLADERAVSGGYTPDPLDEEGAARGTGILQKYAGRVLLITAPTCAVHCRYCFRRHFPYDAQYRGQAFPDLDAIAQDTSVHEVILSGGDPLMLRDEVLTRLLARLNAMPHLARLRIHTRLPVVIPARITRELTCLLADSRLPATFVIHVNHPQELDHVLTSALLTMKRAGVTLLNQSVLLRGVNDRAATLIALSERLHAAGVLPYYLHLPDAVAGTGHFDVCEQRGRALLRDVAHTLPGYLVPKLARELPGLGAKQVFANL